MTTLTQSVLRVPAAELGEESSLPLLYDVPADVQEPDSRLDEDDGLFLGYGSEYSAFPYRAQDNYSHTLSRSGLDCVTLENDFLRAVFVPELGGKLWSLFDKEAEKELLFANPVFRPAYLALRNAWASGGIEWNCGAFTGHHPYTCSPIHTAMLTAEESGLGCPVLRIYSFERIRAVTHQMDFYLPEGARFLHCRMRVVNDSRTATAMYWWSNIAVKTNPRARCVVPADAAFTPIDGVVSKIPVPIRDGRDISYPTNSPIAIDYFYKTRESGRYYTSHLDAGGYGLVQTSTNRLKGRKLFVWGGGQGGRKWQEFLSGEDGRGGYCDGRYCELQCGLANTQYECIPMPPRTAWEWLEYYGPMRADPVKIHGPWREAQQELETQLEKAAPAAQMEQELKQTHAMALRRAGTVLLPGDGFAALENQRREAAGLPIMCPHLDFGGCTQEQALWVSLIRTGSVQGGVSAQVLAGRQAPPSYQKRPEWIALLKAAANGADRDCWLTYYLLGCALLSDRDTEHAQAALERSTALQRNAWNLYASAELYRVQKEETRSAETMLEAARLAPEDDSLCKMTARALCRARLWKELYAFTAGVSERQKLLPRLRLYRALAAVQLGDLDTAQTLLYENGGLEVPDIQEGETTLTELWFQLEEKKADRDGRRFDKAAARPPRQFDFRMFVPEEETNETGGSQ